MRHSFRFSGGVLLILFVFKSIASLAQTAERSFVAAAGGSFANEALSISWNLGGAVEASLATEPLIVIGGMTDIPDEDIVTEVEMPATERISIYPNPTSTSITIENRMPTGIFVQLSSSDGRLLPGAVLTVNPGEHQTMDLSGASAGLYLLTISGTDHHLSTYRILKK